MKQSKDKNPYVYIYGEDRDMAMSEFLEDYLTRLDELNETLSGVGVGLDILTGKLIQGAVSSEFAKQWASVNLTDGISTLKEAIKDMEQFADYLKQI